MTIIIAKCVDDHDLHTHILCTFSYFRIQLLCATNIKSLNDYGNLATLHTSYEVHRMGNIFLHVSFTFMKFRPILCQICVGNVRKCHVLVSRTCRNPYFWYSVG